MKLLIALALSLPLLAADPFVGVWVLNLARSKWETPALKEQTIRWESTGREAYRTTGHGRGPDGKPAKWQFQTTYDGKEHAPAEPQGWDRVISRRISDRVVEDTFFVQGKLFGVERREVSADGKTLTYFSRLAGPPEKRNVLVYDRK
ncbi:MAG: hypothetical protein K2X35_21215 [Bryobacteraceae bacterium]|nr:hypothetical protein [Bryobacteraceae bacterium]